MDEVFAVGDIVTRDGTDEHRVLGVDPGYGVMTVECIRAPTHPDMPPWIPVGEQEMNMIRRYTLVRRCESVHPS